MARTNTTYSDSWFRVAGQRVALRAHVRVFRQRFRGELWYVFQDPLTNDFFRLRPGAYNFIVRLSLERTVESVWEECAADDPIDAPGQEEALRLLAQLYGANLLQSTLAPDATQLFERYRKRKTREVRAYLLNIMFARVPLLDPDAWLKALQPVARAIFGRIGALVWLGVVAFALKVVIEHGSELASQTQGVLAPGNLPLLYLGLVLVKTAHEFGHAIACRRFGGEVHTMGVMFLLFTPVPYMDATSSWAFRSRWHRALVGGAGMIVEIFVAAIAAFVWAATVPGVVHSVAYNMMFVASVSTVLFNANPLMRFDGYYILVDLLDIPNLHQRAGAQVRHVVERFVFGVRESRSPTQSPREAGWLVTFALSSHTYRIFLFASILLFLANRFLVLGVIMTITCVISWILVPLGRFATYLVTNARLHRVRGRAFGVVGGVVALLVVALGIIPFPNHFRAPGTIEATEFTVVAPATDGRLVEIFAPSGARVVAGDRLFRLENPELALDYTSAQAQLEQARAMELRAMREQTADLAPIASRIAALTKLLSSIEDRRDALLVRAPHDGVWVAPTIDRALGAPIERGTPAGHLVNDRRFLVRAIVSQEDASRLFEGGLRGSEVRVRGQADENVAVVSQTIIPAERQRLPSAALGWRGGGNVAVEMGDPKGTRAAETFFEVRATLADTAGVRFVQGRSASVRFTLAPEPLLTQWSRRLRQLLLKRYGL